ncbi:MAG TPA: glycosyltransferase [Pedobacter sp.]|jgi:glycosyltransferase involved in cell wall biosynthesis
MFLVDNIFIAAFLLFQLAFWIQLYYLTIFNSLLSKFKIADNEDVVRHPVSVIICARNEEKNLQKNLPAILQQDYPDFEVIVVNDCSGDDSHMILRGFSSLYKHLKVVTINEHERFKHGKKFAVSLGIKAATKEHLLFTDADCEPTSNKWIDKMQRHFQGQVEIVLGYSPYKYERGFVNKLIRFETFSTALNYFSFALGGRPYMGVGRNMAYTKSLFFKGKGFASHMHIPSGDDDLFVNQNATTENVAIELHQDSHMWSAPKTTFLTYFNQKLRHMGAGKVYKSLHKQMLTYQTGSALLFYVALGCLILLKAQWWILLSFYLLRLLVQLLVYYPVLKKFKYKDLIWWVPVLDLIFNFYILVLSIASLFKKKVKWK